MIHIAFLIYYFSLTPSSSDLFYVGNMVMSCELFIGAIYLFARITRITKLFNNVLTLSEIDKLTDKKIKADNNMLLNTFELRGGKKG